MKKTLKIIIVLLVSVNITTANAQLLKRLKTKIKNKVEHKVEEKVEREIDNKIDSIGKKKTKTAEELPVTTFGSVVITHSNTYGTVNIPEVAKVKVEKTNSDYNFRGSWWSHDADIHDGFFLTIKTTDDLRHDNPASKSAIKRTFKIPEEATLKLSYDPTLPYYSKSDSNYKRAVTDAYQSYAISKGEVTVDVLSAEAIQISFSGKVSLKKTGSQGANSDTYLETSVIGAIDGSSPQFIDNTSFTSKSDSKETTGGFSKPQITNTTAKPGTYQFTFETVVKVTTSEDDRSYNLSYLLNPNETYMAIKADMSEYSEEDMEGESIIVMDDGNSHIFVETSGMKIQMSQSMMGDGQMNNPTEEMANYDYSKITKTGNTKTVLGAKCYEYIMSDANVKMNLWVAPSVNLPNWFVQNKDVLNGHIMAYTMHSKDGDMSSETIAIKDNISKTIDPKEYKKMF
jgi:hypothetical protein